MLQSELISFIKSTRSNFPELNSWNFRLNGRLSKTLGRCLPYTNTVEISTFILDYDNELIFDTVLHEMAHAIDFTRNGVNEDTMKEDILLHGKPFVKS